MTIIAVSTDRRWIGSAGALLQDSFEPFPPRLIAGVSPVRALRAPLAWAIAEAMEPARTAGLAGTAVARPAVRRRTADAIAART